MQSLCVLQQKIYDSDSECVHADIVGVFTEKQTAVNVALDKCDSIASLAGTISPRDMPGNEVCVDIRHTDTVHKYVKYICIEVPVDTTLPHALPKIPFCNRKDFEESNWDFGSPDCTRIICK